MSKGERTRQQIIECAAPLFNQRGFDGCSMKDIMDATGLEKGGLYRHFSSKEDLAAEVFLYSRGLSFAARGIDRDANEDALTALRNMIARFVDTPSAVPGGCPLLNTAIDSDDGNPRLRELAREALGDWKKRIARIVKQGISGGELRADADPTSFANAMIATLEGALMITRLEGNRRALRDAQAALELSLEAMTK